MAALDSEFATRLVVSLIKSPLYNENQVNLDKELQAHFSKAPRRLTLGEHFSVRSRLDTPLTCQFKVTEVEPSGLAEFWVDTSHTSLVLTEQGVKDKWIWPEE